MAVSTVPSATGYSQGGLSPGPLGVGADEDGEQDDGFWSLSKLRQSYTTYLSSKTQEIQEQQIARRYRHGAQWTSDQIKVLNDRKQPVVTYNRIGRKIDGIVGLCERLRQDPKAFPRTPIHQQGADLATACLRYLIDSNRWEQKSPRVAEGAAIDGLAGVELGLKLLPQKSTAQVHLSQGQQQEEYDITFEVVDNDGFFYDPRSFMHDFSDVRFIGVGKWVDEEMLKEMMPDLADEITSGMYSGADLTSGSDRDNRWFSDNGRDFRQVRLVDLWYRGKRGWQWSLFTGGSILKQGESPFKDDHGESVCKYIMFSAAVDHDGDRYGFTRNLMSAQDEINQRRSKALHELSSRRIIATKAAIADNNVEQLRREAARADGIVLTHTSIDEIRFDDQAKQAAVMGQLEMLQDAKQEIENFGPNPALVGDARVNKNQSGRAIQLLQQAGIAELGPYMVNMRAWKIRLYTALFNAAQQYWTNERWIRVTDNQGKPQFVGINQQQTDPMTGQPTVVNPIGELDVDIILDEGPDTVTMMQDTYDAISQALPSLAPMLQPDAAKAVLEVLVETSPLPAEVKQKFRDVTTSAQGQPSPEAQKAQMQMEAEKQKNQATLQMQAATKQQDMQIKQQESAIDIQLEREKAQLEMQLEREKADLQLQLAREKMVGDFHMQRQKTGLEGGQMVVDEASGKVLDPAEERLHQALAQLVGLIEQSHQSMIGAINKPRKTMVVRDPVTRKVIGAHSTTEG